MRAAPLAVAVLLLAALAGPVAPAQEPAIPPQLEPWRAWVLHDHPHLRCPFIATAQPESPQATRCAWPQRLTLDLEARGGTFAQRWEVYAESWVRLPGNLEHWPQDVRVGGAPAAVVTHESFPALRLPAGTHSITGRLAWSTRPETLWIAPDTALVELRLDGRPVAQPERPGGALWLGKRRTAEQREQMDIQVYRLLEDETPARLTTQVRLQVAGDAREVLLGRVLPDGFVPLSLESAPLAARLEPDGRLRVQVRAGDWEILLAARGTNVASSIARPKPGGPWPRDEIWSFAGNDRLRVASVEGAEGIDPGQANVPDEWREYPAFRMPEGAVLKVVERGRGLANADDNRLQLARQLWLDFDHGGFTAIDQITGEMRRDWRLEVTPPFRLESARSDGDVLLVTERADEGGAGIELRDPTPQVTATLRADRSSGALPATGWNARFEQVSGELQLPPGHRLLAVLGADRAPTSWIERWGLWGFFGVLVVAVFAGWFAGPVVGAIAFAGLLLTYQESAAYIWLWANLLAAAALARHAPEGRLRRAASAYRTAGFIVLAFALLPFLWGQARLALYPQLVAGELSLPMAADVGMQMNEAPVMPAPAAEKDEGGGVGAEAEIMVTGTRIDFPERYAPGTVLQAGPGIPEWRYEVHPYHWSGPVEATETVRFLYVGPTLLGVWRLAGIVLLVLLFGGLLAASYGSVRRTRGGAPAAPSPAAVLLVGAMLASIGAPSVARAEATPDTSLLTELRQRLLRAPRCHPSCADIMAARVTVTGERLDIALEVSALASMAVAMPGAGDHWHLDTVTVDGRSAVIAREPAGTYRVPVERGAHVVRLAGRLADAGSVRLAFPVAPRVISVASEGWDVAGVNDGRLLSGSLELNRLRAAGEGAAAALAPSDFPPFVRATRELDLGLDWELATTIERIAPQVVAFAVEVPLLPGESVLTEEIEVRERGGRRVALVGFERGSDLFEWQSAVARTDSLLLELPQDVARSEVWRFTVSPQWNVRFEGFPAVLPEELDGDQWVYEFHPRPGEKLDVRIARPKAVPGRSLAIDSVRHDVVFGDRSTDESLQIAYRSTQGGRHTIVLPAAARVSSVTLDDEPVQLRPDDGRLSVGLLPGEHEIGVHWTLPRGISASARPSPVDLGSAASNVHTTLELPPDRWALLAHGKGVGPAVLYWIELAVFLATALLLGSWSQSPLRTHEWLLLGIGLSTFAWSVFALVAAWLLVMRWRERWPGNVAPWLFNTVQVLLAALTVITLATLVFSGIRESLLGSPDMGVAGPGSYGHRFVWFLDQTDGALPLPQVLSVPMWVYRVLMFAWASWIALALLRWVRWAWGAWKANGLWRGRVITAPASQAHSQSASR